MPELPEVENVAKGLLHLEGKILGKIQIIDSRVWFESELPVNFFQKIKLNKISRHGKYLILDFSKAAIFIHLRMTGKVLPLSSTLIPPMVKSQSAKKKGKGLQLRTVFLFPHQPLAFYDPRRFGTLSAVKNKDHFIQLKKLAPDPINEPQLSKDFFIHKIPKTKKNIKAALLDQSIFCGAGNIYADEALFKEKIHPETPAYRIANPEALWNTLYFILRSSIESGGSSIINYVNAEGKKGKFAQKLLVYGKTNLPCTLCKSAIKCITLAGRSTHFCPKCQRKNQAFVAT